MLELTLPAAQSSAEQGAAPRRLGPVALVVGAVAMVVALIGSWIPSLWGDEAASMTSATRPLGSLFMMLGHVDAVHGLYYVALHFWVDVFGSSPFALRLPSAFAIGVTAAAVTWMSGRLGSLRLAVFAGGIAAILPRLTYAGEEARAYAFDAAIAAVICAVAVEIALRARRSPAAPTTRLWVAYGALLTLGIYSFLYDGLMALAVGAFLAVTPSARRQLRPWAVSTAAAVVCSIPLIVFAFLERSQISYLVHQTEVTPFSVLVQMWFSAVPFAIVAWALIAIAVGDLVLKALRRRRARAQGEVMPAEPDPRRDLVVLALCWLLIPMGLLIVTSPVLAGFTARYGTFAAPAAAVLMAVAVDRISRRVWMAAVPGVLILATAVPVWVGQREPYAMNQSDWNEIAATIQAHAQKGDGIVFDEGERPSRRTRLAMDTDPAAFSAVRDVDLRSPYAANPTWYDKTYTVDEAASLGRFAGVDRVWVVEYSLSGHTDTWGIPSLERLGYHATQQFVDHTSVITLFTR
ncbi:MAG: glycosyltransferase family 39 protein [Humibacter sp.]